MADLDIKGPVRAVDVPQIFDAMLEKLHAAQAIGEMPQRHADPPRHLSILFWIGSKRSLTAYASLFESYPGVVWLDVIWVAPVLRGKGIGRALIERIMIEAKANDMKKIELGTDADAMMCLARELEFFSRAVVMGREL